MNPKGLLGGRLLREPVSGPYFEFHPLRIPEITMCSGVTKFTLMLQKRSNACGFWGFQSTGVSSPGLPAYDAVQCCGRIPTFERSVFSPSSGWRWR